MVVDIVHVEMPEGKGRKRKRSDIDLGNHLKRKGSVITIRNDDDLCLARALVVAVAKASGDKRYKYLADHRKPLQGRRRASCMRKRGYPLVRVAFRR